MCSELSDFSGQMERKMGICCQVSVASQPDLNRSFERHGSAAGNRITLEKAWHGLHYLLTGEAWEGEGPLAFLLAGSNELDEDEESPIRWIGPSETRQVHQALSNVSDEILWSRFDASEMEELEIYPGIWDEDEEDLKEEYLSYFHELKQIVATAEKTGQGLILTLG